MAGLSEYEKAKLARQLESEFNKNEAVPEGHGGVQRYSESTKTLYSDEELAKRMIHRYEPLYEKEEKPELTTDEMLALLQAEQNRTKEPTPVRRGYAKIESSEGKWHS